MFSNSNTTPPPAKLGSQRTSPRTKSTSFSPESVRPPSPLTLLASLSPGMYETPVREFDAVKEAMALLDGSEDPAQLEAHLLARIEQVDLIQDAVQVALDKEIRKSASGLVQGMKQVQELDLDITRTTLQVTGTRRRLAAAREGLTQAELKVAGLARLRENARGVQSVVEPLLQARELQEEIDKAVRVEDAIEKTHELLTWLNVSMDSRLESLVKLESATKSRLPGLEMLLEKELGLLLLQEGDGSLMNGEFDTNVYASIVKSHQVLKISNLPLRVNKACEDILLDSFSRGEDPVLQAMTVLTSFEKIRAWHRVNDAAHQDSEEEWIKIKEKLWQLVEKLTGDLLKSPDAKALQLDQFKSLIARCDELVQFGRDFQGNQASLSLAGSIRTRARAYALQIQVEGFDEMRGYLMRETWEKLSSNVNPALVLQRYGLLEENSTLLEGKALSLTVTTATGLPLQVSRTLELMRKLPQTSGEAFTGLQRCFDVYFLSMLVSFTSRLDLKDLFERPRNNPTLYTYASTARENLKDWFSSEESLISFGIGEEMGWRRAVVACESLEFVLILALSTKPLMEPLLPAVERGVLCKRMYVEIEKMRPHLEKLVRRGAVKKHVPEKNLIDGMAGVGWESECNLRASPHGFVDECLEHMKATWTLLNVGAQEGNVYSMSSIPALWDEAMGLVLEALLDGFSIVRGCTPEGRAGMSLDLACLVNGLHDIAGFIGPASLKQKLKLEDFIKSYYFDTEEDLLKWVKSRRKDLAVYQVLSMVEVGMFGQSPTGKRRAKDVKTEIEKIYSRPPSPSLV